MKGTRVFQSLLVFLLVALIAGCNDRKAQSNSSDKNADDSFNDSTVYGKCGEGTAMHVLQLIEDNGDSIFYYFYDEDDIQSDIQGGLFIGDRLAVVPEKGENDILYAKKVINLTSLLGKWESIDKSFEIREGGIITSDDAESCPYTEWKILNGKLILSADTFEIYSLGADSLSLENNNGIYDYKRISDVQEKTEPDAAV